ncbi:MAG: hypothetical protein V3U51_06345, partial [Thermoplasmata archaeon]
SYILRFDFLNINKYSLDGMREIYSSLTQIGTIACYEDFSEAIDGFKELKKIHAEDVAGLLAEGAVRPIRPCVQGSVLLPSIEPDTLGHVLLFPVGLGSMLCQIQGGYPW